VKTQKKTARRQKQLKIKIMDKIEYRNYLESKDLSQVTISVYTSYVERFFLYIKKEEIQITKPDILKYLEYLKNNKNQQNITRRNQLIAINHYFTCLYKSEKITENPCLLLKIRGVQKKILYNIYTPEELDTLFDNYYQYFVRGFDDSNITKNQRKQAKLNKERNAVILSILFNQGVVTSEIEKIEIEDIDLIKAKIKIRGKKNSERFLPLKATQIGLFMHYLQNIRPQLLEYQSTETNRFLLSLPSCSNDMACSEKLMIDIFKLLAKQVKMIDKKFFNFQQIRASVITFWLKTQGLRKTQYLAGHRHINSTEAYLPNNLDNLIDDINKLHPF
jgi:site-specific recombinase XerD